MTHEIRKAIGRNNFVPTPAVATASTPRRADLDEQARLAATFPEGERSACRSCSRWIGPAGRWSEMQGWRLCGACEDEYVTPDGSAEMLVWRHLLNDDELTEDEAGFLNRSVGSPWFHGGPDARADMPGHDKRWSHIDKGTITKAKRMIRDQRFVDGVSVNDAGFGCGMCGCRLSIGGWFASKMLLGEAKATQWPLCRPCLPYYQAAASPINPADLSLHALGAALGLTRAGRVAAAPVGSVDVKFRPYASVHPGGDSGTETPWEYAQDVLPRIRLLLGAEFPTRIELTGAEKAEINQRKLMKAADDALVAARASRRVSVLG